MGGRFRRALVPLALAACLALIPGPPAAPWGVQAPEVVTLAAKATTASAWSAAPSPAPAAALGLAAAQASAKHVDCTKTKCIALTFDDGPGPYTLTVLRALQASHARATFFVLGKNVAAHPETLRRLVAAGMVVGDHSWDHREYTRLSAAQQKSETSRTAQAIVAAGVPAATLFRPPYGAFNSATKRLGWPLILWDVDTLDWKNRNASATTTRALATARRGSIVLMHDIVPSTAKAVPGIIRRLQAKGYTLVTVPELLGTTRPGVVYTNGSR